MNLGDVMTQVRAALKTIPGMRVPTGHSESLHPPAALVTFPESVEFHQTYGVGGTKITDMLVLILVPDPGSRTAMDKLLPYVAEVGASSVKAVLEGYAYTALDIMTVRSVDFETVEYAEVPYLAAMFHTEIIGKGATP